MPAHEHLDALEVRFAPPADDGTIEGVAMRFGVVDTYGSTFDPAAFSGLEGRSVPMLWSHRTDEVIGSWSGFTIGPKELRVRGKLNLEVQRAREARAMLVAGDIRGLSVGFNTLKSEARAGGVRHIVRAALHEISLVALPSVPGTGVTTIRSDDRAGAAARLAEAARSAARAIQRTRA